MVDIDLPIFDDNLDHITHGRKEESHVQVLTELWVFVGVKDLGLYFLAGIGGHEIRIHEFFGRCANPEHLLQCLHSACVHCEGENMKKILSCFFHRSLQCDFIKSKMPNTEPQLVGLHLDLLSQVVTTDISLH